MKNSKLKKYIRVSVLSAIAYILQMLGSMFMPKVAGFLEIEISDFPAFVAAFAMGPAAGILVELLKNILHSFSTTTGFVGEFANFVVNGIFVFTAGIIYKYNRNRNGALWGMVLAVISMTAMAIVVNLFVMLPLYMPNADFNAKLSLVITYITPFNFCKGTVLSLITYLSYKKIKPLLD